MPTASEMPLLLQSCCGIQRQPQPSQSCKSKLLMNTETEVGASFILCFGDWLGFGGWFILFLIVVLFFQFNLIITFIARRAKASRKFETEMLMHSTDLSRCAK